MIHYYLSDYYLIIIILYNYEIVYDYLSYYDTIKWIL